MTANEHIVFRGKISVYTKRTRYRIEVITFLENRGEAIGFSIFSTAKNIKRGRSFSFGRRVKVGKEKTRKVRIVFNEAGFFSPKDTWKCWSKIRIEK
ncbi:hypothetical protein IBX65_05455 [Candidatus Aerophobetes bacterium]|nr:hypothetical protein [Candidatus Aerophobetes bacterium]